MARDILIIPNRGNTASNQFPEIQFNGLSASTISLKVDDDGSVVYTGDYGSLFNITDSKDGLLHSVNDVSGLPILQVYSYDYVQMGKFDKNTLVVNSDKVGVGLTAPSTKLHIYGTQSGLFRLQDGTQNSGYLLISDLSGVATWTASSNILSTLGGVTGSGTTNYVARWISSSQLSSTGSIYDNGSFVGIGTTTPSATLDVNGTIYSQGFSIRQLSSTTVFKTSGINGYQWNSSDDLNALMNLKDDGKLLINGGNPTETGVKLSVQADGTNPNDKGFIADFRRKTTGNSGVIISSKESIAYLQSYSPSISVDLILGAYNISNGFLDTLSLTSDNKVGVGLTAPSTKLHIYGTQSGLFRLQDGTQNSGYVLISDTNGVGTWTSSSVLFAAGTGLTKSGAIVSIDFNSITGTGLTQNGSQISISSALSGNGLTSNSGVLSVNTNNGLSVIDDNVGIGGTLSRSTQIIGDSYDFGLSDIATYSISTEQAKVTTSDGKGIVYTSDYSSGFVANSLVSKAYVDALASGLDAKSPVKTVVATGSITLSGIDFQIDGYTVSAFDRILVAAQAGPNIATSSNGIYIATSSAWYRADDADGNPNNEVSHGNYVFVTEGNLYEHSGWVLTTTDANDPNNIQVGTDSQGWVQFSEATQLNAGDGLYSVGRNINVGAGTGLTVSADLVSIANTTVTSGNYGTAGSVAQFTVNSQGQLVGATSVSIDINSGQINDFTTSVKNVIFTDSNFSDGITVTFSVTSGASVSAEVTLGSLTASRFNIVNPASASAGWSLGYNNSGQFEWFDPTLVGDITSISVGAGLTGGGNSGGITIDVNVDNGLEIIDDYIGLGGTLSRTTVVDGAGYDLFFEGFDNLIFTASVFDVAAEGLISLDAGTGSIQIVADEQISIISLNDEINLNSKSFVISSSSSSITTDSLRGLEYSTDYSATFVTHSLVSKSYVDNAFKGSRNIYVDAIYGSNSTAQKYDFNRAYKTILAAEAVASDGDTIYVMSSTQSYTDNGIASSLPSGFNLNYYFERGAKIDVTLLGPTLNIDIFVPNGSNINVLGYGEFIATGCVGLILGSSSLNMEMMRAKTDNQSTNGSATFEVISTTSYINIKCLDILENTQGNIIVSENKGQNIFVDSNRVSASGAFVRTRIGGVGEQSIIKCKTNLGIFNRNNLFLGGGYPTDAIMYNEGALVELDGKYIKSSTYSTANGIITTSGITKLYGDYTMNTNMAYVSGGNVYQYGSIIGSQSYIIDGGNVYLKNRLESTGSYSVNKSGGNLVLDGASIISSTWSIYSSTTQDVICYSGVASKDINNNITVRVNPLSISSYVI